MRTSACAVHGSFLNYWGCVLTKRKNQKRPKKKGTRKYRGPLYTYRCFLFYIKKKKKKNLYGNRQTETSTVTGAGQASMVTGAAETSRFFVVNSGSCPWDARMFRTIAVHDMWIALHSGPPRVQFVVGTQLTGMCVRKRQKDREMWKNKEARMRWSTSVVTSANQGCTV